MIKMSSVEVGTLHISNGPKICERKIRRKNIKKKKKIFLFEHQVTTKTNEKKSQNIQ